MFKVKCFQCKREFLYLSSKKEDIKKCIHCPSTQLKIITTTPDVEADLKLDEKELGE